MSERGLEEKAFSRYMREGDFGMDVSTGFPLIVRDNCTKQFTRVCEVFGFFHEWGSVYSKHLRPITKEEFDHLKERLPADRQGWTPNERNETMNTTVASPAEFPCERHCGRCHACGAPLVEALDGEEWCDRCGAWRRYRTHGFTGCE